MVACSWNFRSKKNMSKYKYILFAFGLIAFITKLYKDLRELIQLKKSRNIAF